MALGVVLIVDDQEVIRQAVGTTLIKAGYEVLQAEDGRGAIELLQNDNNGEKVDTIICDLQMPNVGGAEAIRHFQRHFPRIPVVVLTSSREQRDVVESYRLGVNSYIVKPVNFEGFIAAVQVASRRSKTSEKGSSSDPIRRALPMSTRLTAKPSGRSPIWRASGGSFRSMAGNSSFSAQ